MSRIARIAALAAALSAPAAVWAQPGSVRASVPAVGATDGSTAWPYESRRNRTTQASGVAIAGILLAVAAASSMRGRH
jgi:hypothetical protein